MTNITELFAPLRLRSGAGGDYNNGLCLMEAVSWLASEGATDHPKCACPILGRFAIRLNDRLNDENRQQLLPLALPLTGTRSKQHERQRAEYITLRVIREIISQAFDAISLKDHAEALRNVTNLGEARTACQAAKKAAAAYAAAYAAYAAAYAADAAAYAADDAAAAYAYADAADAAAYAYAADDAAARQKILLQCIPILQGAIELGPNGSDQWPEFEARAVELGEFAGAELEPQT